MGKLKIPITSEEMRRIVQQRKAKKSKSKEPTPTKLKPSQVSEETSEPFPPEPFVFTDLPPLPSPPSKKQKTSHTYSAAEKQKMPLVHPFTDDQSPRTDTTLFRSVVETMLTQHDQNILDQMTAKQLQTSTLQAGITLLQNSFYATEYCSRLAKENDKKEEEIAELAEANKQLEKDIFSFKESLAEASKRAEEAEQKWSETGHELEEAKTEIAALRADFTKASNERDELEARAKLWPSKKQIVYKKAVSTGYVRGQNDLLRQFKAGKIDFPDPESSDEGSGDEEISSDEEEFEDPDVTLGDVPSTSEVPPAPSTEPNPNDGKKTT